MWVYGFQSGEFIKIGIARHMASRRHALQLGNPIKLKLVIDLAVHLQAQQEWQETSAARAKVRERRRGACGADVEGAP